MVTNRQLSRTKLLVLLAIILLAAFLRLSQIDTIPPGDGHDPAYYGLDALQILDGELPLFFPTNFGREALFSYLVAVFVAFLGVGPLAVHLASSFVGILTVPAVFLVTEELFGREEGAFGQFGGLLAAFATAISYWHLHWSRFGVRAVLVPLFVSLTIFFLWRALRTDSKRHLVASGVFLGLGMYTYQAARILPLLVVLAFVYFWISRRSLPKGDLLNLAIVALVALLVFAPLGAYFLTHPSAFGERIGQTLVFDATRDLGSNLGAAWNQVLKVPLVLLIQGEDFPTHGLVNRPALNLFLSALFVVGVIVSLLRIKRLSYLFVLTWLVVMAAPALFSQHGSVAKRVIGAFPAIMALIAMGALVPWTKLRRWSDQHKSLWTRAATGAAAILLLAGFFYSAASTYRDYFVVWAGDPDMFTHFEVGFTAIGEYVGAIPPQEDVYVSPGPANHPSVVYNSGRHPGTKGYDGRFCLVLPERARADTTYVVVPSDDPDSLDLLQAAFPRGEVVAEGPLHYQQPYFYAFEIPEGATAGIQPAHPLKADWGDKMRLLGYDMDALVYRPGDTIQLALIFQAAAEMDTDYTFFAHLLGPADPVTGDTLWGQVDSEPCGRSYPTSQWGPGEIVRDRLIINIPAEAPPGDYQVNVGFYSLETMTRLPATDANGQAVPDDAVPLVQLEVQAGDEN